MCPERVRAWCVVVNTIVGVLVVEVVVAGWEDVTVGIGYVQSM